MRNREALLAAASKSGRLLRRLAEDAKIGSRWMPPREASERRWKERLCCARRALRSGLSAINNSVGPLAVADLRPTTTAVLIGDRKPTERPPSVAAGTSLFGALLF